MSQVHQAAISDWIYLARTIGGEYGRIKMDDAIWTPMITPEDPLEITQADIDEVAGWLDAALTVDEIKAVAYAIKMFTVGIDGCLQAFAKVSRL